MEVIEGGSDDSNGSMFSFSDNGVPANICKCDEKDSALRALSAMKDEGPATWSLYNQPAAKLVKIKTIKSRIHFSKNKEHIDYSK